MDHQEGAYDAAYADAKAAWADGALECLFKREDGSDSGWGLWTSPHEPTWHIWCPSDLRRTQGRMIMPARGL